LTEKEKKQIHTSQETNDAKWDLRMREWIVKPFLTSTSKTSEKQMVMKLKSNLFYLLALLLNFVF